MGGRIGKGCGPTGDGSPISRGGGPTYIREMANELEELVTPMSGPISAGSPTC